MHPELEQMLRENPQAGYLRFHLPRFNSLFELLDRDVSEGQRVLDIGRSAFTEVLRARFGRVDTLGFGGDLVAETGNHYGFDLNDSSHPARRRTDLPKYDVVVFAEVLEHLHTSPSEVLQCLRTLLADNGVLLLQTPNAVSLNKRLKMLRGRNPYELIRDSEREPGHFREYTRAELESYLLQAGFSIESFSYENYFDHRYIQHRDDAPPEPRAVGSLYNAIFAIMPGVLKSGMCFVVRPVA